MIQGLTPPVPAVTMNPASLGARDPARVAEGFEAMFLAILLEPMEKAAGSFFGEGTEARIFAGMFRRQLADQLARARPLGIADQIESNLRGREQVETAQKENDAQRARDAYGKGNR